MRRSVVFMLSGQGSQSYQMGRALYDRHAVFRQWMLKLDQMAYEMCGVSVVNELYESGKRATEPFDQLFYTHPAIFMVEYAAAQLVLEMGIEPDYVLGISLGEFAAAALAGVLTVEEALEAVIRQAQAVERRCPAGGMLAIIHDLSIFAESPLLYANSELALVNSDSHFVIAGEMNRLETAEQYLKRQGILYQRLPVSYGFHSAFIAPAEQDCLHDLQGRFYRRPHVPIVSSLDGEILHSLPERHLWEAVRQTIKLPEAVSRLQSKEVVYVDLGPGGSLANLVKRGLNGAAPVEAYPVFSMFNREMNNLEKIRESLCTR